MHFTKALHLTVCTTVVCAGVVFAQEQETLTKAQWSKRVGESAKSSEVLERNLTQVDQGDRVEFTSKTLKAVTRLPLGPNAKAARYIESSVLCIDGAQEDVWYGVIAESIALAPVSFLPALSKELAGRMDPVKNSVPADRYKAIAEKGVETCVARNAQAEDTKVRNTFAILVFFRAAADIPDLLDALLAKLPDDRSRELAAAWIADAMNDDYTAILAAVDVKTLPPMPAITIVGKAGADRLLLSYLSLTDSAFDAIMASYGTGSNVISVDIQTDAGYRQTPWGRRAAHLAPAGYQNQGIKLRRHP